MHAKQKKNYYRLFGVLCWDIFDSKAITLPRNYLSFPKKSRSEVITFFSQIIAYFITVGKYSYYDIKIRNLSL